jgi:hypothetical protein
MSKGEIGVFALLAGSIGAGIYRLVTDPWSEGPLNAPTTKRDEPSFKNAEKQNDGGQPPNINDGVTNIQFDDAKLKTRK